MALTRDSGDIDWRTKLMKQEELMRAIDHIDVVRRYADERLEPVPAANGQRHTKYATLYRERHGTIVGMFHYPSRRGSADTGTCGLYLRADIAAGLPVDLAGQVRRYGPDTPRGAFCNNASCKQELGIGTSVVRFRMDTVDDFKALIDVIAGESR